MGVGYDDDTLRAEHERYTLNERKRRQARIGVIGFLIGIWPVCVGFMLIAFASLSFNVSIAVFFLCVAWAASVWVVTWHLGSW